MNREETLALWRLGKEAWENWRRGVEEKKAALERTGGWTLDWYGEGQNDETTAWLEEASADFTGTQFETDADFAGIVFPGPANFENAQCAGKADFTGTVFAGNTSFDYAQFKAGAFAEAEFQGFASFSKTQFDGRAGFEKAKFLKNSDFAPCARFRQTEFSAGAAFAGAHFAGAAEFVKARAGAVSFDGCEFHGDTLFTSSEFVDEVSFYKVRFTGSRVDFGHATFHTGPRFQDTHFGGSRAELAISGACNVNFEAARFGDGANFARARFVGGCEFKDAQFGGAVLFDGAQFVMPANFSPADFSASCSFQDVQFMHLVDFTGSRFVNGCAFNRARFDSDASFDQAHFGGPAHFDEAEFRGEANFRGAEAGAALVFEGARCVAAPNLEGGAFAIEPALAKLVKIKPKRRLFGWLAGGRKRRSLLGRWRRSGTVPPEPEWELPQAAWQQEHSTYEEPARTAPVYAAPAAPVRAAPPASGPAWPIFRVLVLWALTVAIFAPFYLSQRPHQGFSGLDTATQAGTAGSPAELATQILSAVRGVFDSGPCVHGSSFPAGEAFILAAKNALVFVPWDSEHATRRVYGCLYGLEEGAPVIPFTVSLGALLQAVLSLLLVVSALGAARRMR